MHIKYIILWYFIHFLYCSELSKYLATSHSLIKTMAKTFGHRTEVFVICACQQQIPHQLKADKLPSLPLCSGSCQKSKLDRSNVEKNFEFKTNLRHMVTVLHVVIDHSSFDRKIWFFHLLCSSFPVPMPLSEILRSNVTIALCRVKIFFND